MEFINFDACIDDDNISDVYEVHLSVDKNNDFITTQMKYLKMSANIADLIGSHVLLKML